MSGNTFGTLFCVTNFGESHGPAIGCVIDGCPPGMALSEADIQHDLDRRRPGTSRHVTQRNEPDQVQILSGVYEGKTTGTPIALLIQNTDQRSKDYGNLLQTFRPGPGGMSATNYRSLCCVDQCFESTRRWACQLFYLHKRPKEFELDRVRCVASRDGWFRDAACLNHVGYQPLTKPCRAGSRQSRNQSRGRGIHQSW